MTAAAHSSRSRAWRRSVTVEGTAACELVSLIHFSSSATSCADCQRSSRSLHKHFRMTCSRASGVSGCNREIGGGSLCTMAAMRLVRVFPSKARRPVVISYRSAPNAKMSVRASASSPSSCSGAMYWKVPRIVPSCVSGLCSVAPSRLPTPTPPFASPKSSSLAPVFVIMTLPGFKSR